MLWWERSLRSVANVTRADAVEFLEVAAAIPIQANTETLPLDGANEALVRLSEGLLPATAVLVP
jgi:propanol-preferring alcohol dehydrogenase